MTQNCIAAWLRPTATGLVAALGLAAAACVPGGSGGSGNPFAGFGSAASGGTTPVAATTTPVAATGLSPADQTLRGLVAGDSLRGTNIAGEQFCSFYADNGTMTRVTGAAAPQTGTWNVSNGRVCETIGGYSSCSNFAYQTPSYSSVTITPLEGSGAFPYQASVGSGNQCGTQATTASAPAAVNGYSVRQVTFTDGNGTMLGTYRQTGTGTWVETNAAGATTFNFVESARDEWSVYLLDSSRGAEVQLDLHTREVKFNWLGQPRQPLYRISSAG